MTRAALVVLIVAAWSHRAQAATLPGAELSVSRSDSAEACPDEGAIVAQLAQRLTPHASSTTPLRLDVALDLAGSAFTAHIVVSGRRQGERRLAAEGPACDALRDALLVTLLLLLDDDAESEPAPPHVRPSEPSAAPALLLNAGGAATHGFPSGISSAWLAGLSLRSGAWDVGLSALWAPRRTLSFEPGTVNLSTWGARARGCALLGLARFDAGGCASVLLVSLHGEGQGFSSSESASRAWWLLGAGPELRWPRNSRIAVAFSAQLLLTPHRESFAVRGLPGAAYRSDRFGGWLGLELDARIW